MPIIVLTKKNLLIALLCVALLAGGVFLWLWLRDRPRATETASVMAQVENYELNVLPMKDRQLPVYGVGREDDRIALTIDAAWDADKTPFILDTLDKYNVKATFFLCGTWVKQYPDFVKEISKRGHEIGNHSLSQRHNSSPVMVDRAMRHGVESCWRLASKAVQRQYFGYSAQDKQGMPTNGEFLFAVYEHVKTLLPYDRGQDAFLRELRRINAREQAADGCQAVRDLVY